MTQMPSDPVLALIIVLDFGGILPTVRNFIFSQRPSREIFAKDARKSL
jgi:hypothetical protein